MKYILFFLFFLLGFLFPLSIKSQNTETQIRYYSHYKVQENCLGTLHKTEILEDEISYFQLFWRAYERHRKIERGIEKNIPRVEGVELFQNGRLVQYFLYRYESDSVERKLFHWEGIRDHVFFSVSTPPIFRGYFFHREPLHSFSFSLDGFIKSKRYYDDEGHIDFEEVYRLDALSEQSNSESNPKKGRRFQVIRYRYAEVIKTRKEVSRKRVWIQCPKLASK